MKAAIFLNGSGAILLLTSHEELNDEVFRRKLRAKGIDKYIAFELPVSLVKQRYGSHFKTVVEDLKQDDDLRVMDFDGRRIFQHFTFEEMGEPIFHEAENAAAAASRPWQ